MTKKSSKTTAPEISDMLIDFEEQEALQITDEPVQQIEEIQEAQIEEIQEAQIEEIQIEDLLKSTAKLKDVIQAINELNAKIVKMSSKNSRPKGPKSLRNMTDEDARRIIYGDLMNSSHSQVAKELGLSYGQIYSARQCFTFKHIIKEAYEQDKKKQNPWIHKLRK